MSDTVREIVFEAIREAQSCARSAQAMMQAGAKESAKGYAQISEAWTKLGELALKVPR